MTAAERVARGAALLDEQRPGWAAEIDLTVLDLSHACRCILGQLYAPAFATWRGYGLGLGAMEIKTQDQAIALGFDTEDEEHAELDELWIAEIRRRLETT